MKAKGPTGMIQTFGFDFAVTTLLNKKYSISQSYSCIFIVRR